MPLAADALPPARPPRDLRLDIVRGWMQVSIFVSHIAGTAFAWGIHAAWGLSDSSEQFVLLSGFTLGSVFALKAARGGFGAARSDMARRTLRLYATHLTVFFMFAALVLWAEMCVPLPGGVERLGWSFLVERLWLALPAAFAMLYQPAFMGILPVFVWSMLLLPAFMWAAARAGGWALAPAVAAYVAVQLGLLETPSVGGTGIAFEPFAWAALFLGGALAGRRALLAGEGVQPRRWLVAGAAAVVAAGFWARLVGYGVLPGPEDPVAVAMHKEALAPARLLHALALAYLVAALVPREAAWMRLWPAQALAAIGRHSLRVFCVGLFLAWGASTALARWPEDAAWLDPLLVLGGAGALAAVAWASDGWRRWWPQRVGRGGVAE
ncbi:hypothetical protein GCM10009416_48370 [Craurococcus roseus]|uniref:OpgC domain-containing protein n=1 Tax=Craurococcus roseus TaxID=77585 RepID=A0ABP3R7Z1_9PROT